MNLTYVYRPTDFDEVVGQDFAKSILSGIIKVPEQAPRSLIFYGEYGTGKSSIARIFAKKINGLDRTFKILDSPFYYEFDSAVVGNVDVVRELREMFGHSYSKGYKIIVYDEAHTITNAAQSALLKPLEDSNQNVFYLFLTTDVEKLLKTIRSRSVEIKFDLVSRHGIIQNLKNIIEKEKKQVPDEILEIIATRSSGHVRDSLMLLDKYFIVGSGDFVKNVYLLIDLFEHIFSHVMLSGTKNIKEELISIVKNPLVYVKMDFENFIMKNIFMYNSGAGVFKEMKFQNLMQLFSYYVQNKSSAFGSTSDVFSFLFLLLKMAGGFMGK